MIKLSDYIAKRLAEVYEVKHVFMVSGGGAMHLNDSFGKYIPYICNHHEQASAIAAEGYARYNQKLAVVNVTTGPGGLNALNGVFGQWTDSASVLYVSGQVKYQTTIGSCSDIPLRQLGDQEVDIISVVKPLTKYSKMVKSANEIKYHIDKAVYEAITGRKGPVWLDIPMNIQSAMIDENDLIKFEPPQKPEYDLKIDEVMANLNSSKRPIIIAGHGIRLSQQEETFYNLIKKLKIPVVTTFNGFDVIEESHPNYIGRIGTIGQRAGNFALQNADLVLCLGSRNNIRQASYNYENFAKNAFKIVVDIDKAELDKPTVKPDLKVHADLAEFLPALLNETELLERAEWLNWCIERKNKYHYVCNEEYFNKNNKINPYCFTQKLMDLLGENSIVVSANATPSICLFQSAKISKKQRILCNSGDASMGYDLPAAMGACLSSGNKDTVCFAGDGSIMMNLQELQTVRHYNLPIKLFILNNNGYISIRQTQSNFFEGRLTGSGDKSGVSVPDFAKIANAFDIPFMRIDSVENLEEQIKKVLDTEGPIISEVIIPTDYIFSPKLSSRKLEDGSMVSPSLEDMFPFLSREEYEENMING